MQPNPIDVSGLKTRNQLYWASLWKTAAISVVHETWTPITFAGAFWNFGTLWNPCQTSRIYLPVFGLWRIEGVVSWAFNATGRREAGISLNAGEGDLAYRSQTAVATSSGNTSQGISCTKILGPPNYVVLNCRQDSGGNLNQVYGSFEVKLLEILNSSDLTGYTTAQVSARL